jgi:hypothetical protein
MKIQKPSYNASTRLYTCQLTDGFRLKTSFEEGVTKDLYNTDDVIASLIQPIIEGTAGWFTKPLSPEWLKPRIRLTIPTGDVPSEFEGTAEFVADKLLISKDEFVFAMAMGEMKKSEKVVIEFQEEELPAKATSLQKSDVLKAREKAAKALFRAEMLTQEYIRQRGGEDTDWEDEEDMEDS